jgi:TonB-linked SusC/RagA family outer membrane protein
MAGNETLTDVVILGYTQQSQTKTTAAISKLNIAELQNRPSPNPVQAMQGKIAGVSVPVNSGQPGAGATNIIIRGGTKLNVYGNGAGNSNGNPIGSADNTGPLVVIDGVFRSMDDINPDNIEFFQVMKDAASTAIYGARGANGVIVIRTKGGKFNTKMNLTLNNRTTWETQARDYKYLNATQYLTLARNTVRNTFDPLDKNNLLYNGGFSAGTRPFTTKGQFGRYVYSTALYDNLVSVEGQPYVDNLLANGYMTMDDPLNPGTKLIYADNGYQDKLWKTGLSQNNSIAINGGGENANYNLSTAFTDQKGVFVGTRYKRLDVLGNFGFKLSKNARLDAMVNYQNVQPNYVEAFLNDLTRATRLTPLIRIFKDDGNASVGENYTTRNRFHVLQYDNQDITTERLVARVGGDITIYKGLHFKPSVSYVMDDYSYLFQRKGTPADEIQPGTIRQKTQRTIATRQLMTDQILQYDFRVGDAHSFTILGGFNYTVIRGHNTNLGSQRASNDYITSINEPPTTVINGITVSNVTEFQTLLSESKSASVFGQVNYDYAGKYLVSASLRNDGFSNFAPENKFALFPSASLGWNMHMEKWFTVKPVSMLKLRASWGEAGLSDLALTDTYGGYTPTSYALGSGILRSNLSNPNLVWESTVTTDLAFDAGFLDNRITLTVDWYNKKTKNRLASKPLPSEAPFPSIAYNNGVLQNQGIEVELGGAVIKGRNFSWRTSVAFAKNTQKVLDLPDNGRAKSRQGGDLIYDPSTKQNIEVGGIAEGERPFAMYAYKVLGVFATEADAKAWNATTKDNLASPQGIITGKHAGDFIFQDVNGDGIIDTRDQVFMGYRSPDITGGWQNAFSYKAISLRVGLDYALGHVISNGALARSLGQGRAFNEGAPSQALGDDIWQKEGDAGKKYARFSFADFDFGQRNYIRLGTLGNNNSYGSDVSALIEKGDFVALREITLSYELPGSLVKKIYSTGLSVFASVFNIAYITGYSGINPETYSGYDAVGYPRPRQYTLGATVRF